VKNKKVMKSVRQDIR